MNDLKKYLPIGVLFVAALVVTGVAGWQYASQPSLGQQDSWGFYLWFTPMGYLLLTWLIAGTGKLNRTPIALAGMLVYLLSAFLLLFVPIMPPGLQWHYPIGAACLLLVFIE